jgi:hypothetical protein
MTAAVVSLPCRTLWSKPMDWFPGGGVGCLFTVSASGLVTGTAALCPVPYVRTPRVLLCRRGGIRRPFGHSSRPNPRIGSTSTFLSSGMGKMQESAYDSFSRCSSSRRLCSSSTSSSSSASSSILCSSSSSSSSSSSFTDILLSTDQRLLRHRLAIRHRSSRRSERDHSANAGRREAHDTHPVDPLAISRRRDSHLGTGFPDVLGRTWSGCAYRTTPDADGNSPRSVRRKASPSASSL